VSALADLAGRVAALETRVAALAAEPRLRSAGPTLACIVGAVALEFGVTRAELLGDGRSRQHVRARQAAMLLARDLAQRSTTVIGRALGRDHTTVIHGTARARELAATDPDFAKRLAAARKTLTQRSEA
jgi:chromosomal replication initiator protein